MLDLAIALNLILHSWILPNRVILWANKEVSLPSISRIIEGVLNLALSIIFARILGLAGIVMATGIAAMLTSFWILPLLTARLYNRPFTEFIWHDMSKMLLLFVSLFPIAYLVRGFASSMPPFAGAMFGMSVSSLCGGILLWWLIFDSVLRKRIKHMMFK
jgi:peptidoglycan biosynthesis protein MviN/MurJ (putative lipid II flippase)